MCPRSMVLCAFVFDLVQLSSHSVGGRSFDLRGGQREPLNLSSAPHLTLSEAGVLESILPRARMTDGLTRH